MIGARGYRDRDITLEVDFVHEILKKEFQDFVGKNVNSDKIKIQKTAEIEGVLIQKTLAIEEGAKLKIKTETIK